MLTFSSMGIWPMDRHAMSGRTVWHRFSLRDWMAQARCGGLAAGSLPTSGHRVRACQTEMFSMVGLQRLTTMLA